jgi:hypothetical protein
MVALHAHRVEGIEFTCPRRLFENFIDRDLEIGIIGFEEVFEKESKKLACAALVSKGKMNFMKRKGYQSKEMDVQFKALVSNVVTVVDHFLIAQGHQYSTRHSSNEDGLCSEVQTIDGDMGQNDGRQRFQRFLP